MSLQVIWSNCSWRCFCICRVF